MQRRQVSVCLLLGWFSVFEGRLAVRSDTSAPAFSEKTVRGGVARLPCNVTPELEGDRTGLVIWFKEGETAKTPIYTFDSRDSDTLEKGVPWANESVLGERARFVFDAEPAHLKLEDARESDAGTYVCRVDFRLKPTRNTVVRLDVTVRPESLRITEEGGNHVDGYVLGPYDEGDSLNITCVATGGRPPPKVTWWYGDVLLDDSQERTGEREVRNVLHLEPLERKHASYIFTCQATNDEMFPPLSSSVLVDLNLRPEWVKITGEKRPLSAGTAYNLTCEVGGSKPEPEITWWLGSVRLKNAEQSPPEYRKDAPVSRSVVTFVPTVDDGGKHLSCRGVQPLVRDSGIEDGWTLDVHHAPLVTLELGTTLNGTAVREGDDVYFECDIKSNPWVHEISWKHDGRRLFNDQHRGVIITNQSLVLRSVTRTWSGTYTCVGRNREGDGESEPLELDVKFAPVCRPGQTKEFAVAEEETVRVSCEVEADPAAVAFTWVFENEAGSVEMPSNQAAVEGTRSTMRYTPVDEMDYGTLTCWGRNEIGKQREPCVYLLNPAGKPDSPYNCSIVDRTSDGLDAECFEGFDGGLPRSFVVEVYDSESGKLVGNVTSSVPLFTVRDLEPGTDYEVVLYAANPKGRSPAVRLQSSTLKSTEAVSALARPALLRVTPVLGALVGVVVSLVSIGAAVLVAIRLKSGRVAKRENDAPPPLAAPATAVDGYEEKNPDLVSFDGAEKSNVDDGTRKVIVSPPLRVHALSYCRVPLSDDPCGRRRMVSVPWRPPSPTFRTLQCSHLRTFAAHQDIPPIGRRIEGAVGDEGIFQGSTYCVGRYEGR